MKPQTVSFILFALLLTACAPQATVAPQPTVTLIPPTPSATATATLTPVPTITPEPNSAAGVENLLQGFDQLTTYEEMMKVSAADLLEAAGGKEGTFQDVARMLNEYANAHTTWEPGTAYATLLEARQYAKGAEALTLDYNVPMDLASELPLQYRVMHVDGNVIPGLSEDMTLITVTWPLEGGENMSATMMTGGEAAENRTAELLNEIGESRHHVLMPQFTLGGWARDMFDSGMSKQVGNLAMEVVVDPTTGEKQNIPGSDLLNKVEKLTSARNEKTYVPLTGENNGYIQDWLSLTFFSVKSFGDAEGFNVNPANE